MCIASIREGQRHVTFGLIPLPKHGLIRLLVSNYEPAVTTCMPILKKIQELKKLNMADAQNLKSNLVVLFPIRKDQCPVWLLFPNSLINGKICKAYLQFSILSKFQMNKLCLLPCWYINTPLQKGNLNVKNKWSATKGPTINLTQCLEFSYLGYGYDGEKSFVETPPLIDDVLASLTVLV